jgi:hypothetical protein
MARPLPVAPSAVLAVLAALAAAPRPAAAGVLIEGKSDGADAQRIVLDGKRMRVDGTDAGKKESVIFDGEARRMLRLDPAAKRWSEVTEKDLEQMQGELGKMMEQLPPEQRAQLEASMGKARAAHASTWAKTGRTGEAAGRKCEIHRLVAGEDVQEVCVAPWSAFGLSKADFAALGAFEDFFSKLGAGGAQRGAAAWGDLPGVPLVTWDIEGNERRESFRATKVEKTRVAASEFQPPAGFTKEEKPPFAP